MRVEHLEMEGFRNLQPFSMTPCSTANIISGNNAQGKTNLLEALWLFTGARSFRGSREKDFMPHQGDAMAGMKLTFYAQGRRQTASLRWVGERRQVLLNGIEASTPSTLSGVFCGVVFSPDHMSLVKDGPDARRSMLDVALAQAYPKYNGALTSYQKAMRQRNTLLKDIEYNAGLLDMLDLWDEHIVRYGGYISALRDRYVKRLSYYAREFYAGISGGREQFSLAYQPSYGERDTTGYELRDYQSVTQEALRANRGEDLRLGTTSIGPHRDDLDIRIDGRSARSFGSQGQQRSSVLALKLAECNILEEGLGEAPVVMLDDVMSELDHHRRSFLLNKLENKQVFITCCDTGAFKDLDRGSVFTMEKGHLLHQQDALSCATDDPEKGESPCTST